MTYKSNLKLSVFVHKSNFFLMTLIKEKYLTVNKISLLRYFESKEKVMKVKGRIIKRNVKQCRQLLLKRIIPILNQMHFPITYYYV